MLVEAAALKKSFSGVPALRNASLAVDRGEVHAVLGENGAGKSTLMKILSGGLQQDEGQVLWHGGEPRRIGLVHQEPLLAPHLTVGENLFLGREPVRKRFLLDNEMLRAQARQFLAEHHLPLEAGAVAGRLNAAQKQTLELGRALAGDPELLILDEPTSSLSEAQSQEVLRTVTALRDRGVAIIYISHRLEEVRRVARRVTVLRDGETVFVGELAELSNQDLVRHMAGRTAESVKSLQKRPAGEALLRVEGEKIRFTIHAGEILGLAGLVGAGRTELCHALFGLEPRGDLRVFVGGRERRIRTPQQALATGLAYLPEDRRQSGLLPHRPLRENITLAALPVRGPEMLGWLALAREQRVVAEMIARLRIRCFPEQRAETLSGGNQQKSLLARWMLTGARVFLLDEPARGIDVAAKADVFALVKELAGQGAGVLMVSSEIPELLETCDRLLVMRSGEITRELDPATASREEVLQWAL